MDDSNLCEFCCGLVFWDEKEFMGHKYYRSLPLLKDLSGKSQCPFCKEFCTALLRERPDASDDTRCKFTLDTHHDGFIQLTISFCCSLLSAPDSGKAVKDWDSTGSGNYLEHICYWMIAYAEGKLNIPGRPEKSDRFHNRPDWQSHTMDMSTRFSSVDKWLECCVLNQNGSHKRCSDVKTPGYPRRLLDIGVFQTSNSVRLIDTRTWSSPLPEYTALSHCWGPPTGHRPLQTTSANLEAHKTKIPMEHLPKTFQDAVKITQRLGKKFLWVDSLAIIQDDKQDWQSESAQMAAIYENAYLTIAATTSEDCRGGCDLEPWDLRIIEGKAKTGPGKYRRLLSDTWYRVKLKHANKSWKGAMTRLPLHTRGWTLQEAVLSRRILHMASRHMLWQCRALFDHEDANVRISSYPGLTTDLSRVGFVWDRYRHNYDHTWWTLVNKYSARSLTKSTDRLPAIAGMIRFHSAKIDDTPLLGLWKKTIALDLGWRCQQEQTPKASGVPTWTWLSSEGEIKGPVNFTPESNILQISIDSSYIEWEGQAYVSPLKQGTTLIVKSKIFEASLQEGRSTKDRIRAHFHEALLQPFRKETNCVLEYFSDIALSGAQCTVTYLLLYTSTCDALDALPGSHNSRTSQRSKSKYVVFLVLKRGAPFNPSAYIRIGCGVASLNPEFNRKGVANNIVEPASGFIDHVLRDWYDATVQLC
ncbi:putative Heterokaryon incompatibility domain-containing protein [Seiridium unicorne]|uniref:Heterokaryon incompatibility domain-containing protein n=1 Tax=Seiridium unicorne TaxID=138068 RepID=A0ABR2VAZ4_9PEZI